MERAGTAVAELVAERYPGRVAVVCGEGNNGGDGRVCARVLRERGREVDVIDGFGDLGEPDVIVDALLGIGLKDAPHEDVARMIEVINGTGKPVVAVDVPSGVNASTGEVAGAAIRAEATVTFEALKVGHVVAPGRFHAGAVHVAAIGLGDIDHEHALVDASVLERIPRKTATSTKYRAGHVLVVGGSPGPHRRAGSRGAGRVPRGRRLRHAGGARVLARRGGRTCSRRSNGRCPRTRPGASSPVRPSWCSSSPSAPTQSSSGPASAGATVRAISCGRCSSGSHCRSSSTPTRSGSSSRSSGRRRLS